MQSSFKNSYYKHNTSSTTIQNNSFESALSQLGHSLTSSTSTSVTNQSKQACILTLLKILDNILSDPNKLNVKLRKLKVANKNGPFYKRAGKWYGSINFLIECGFVGSSSSSSSKGIDNSATSGDSINADGKEESLPTQLKLENEDISKLLQGRKALCNFAINVLNISSSVLPSCPVKDDVDDNGTTKKKSEMKVAQDVSKVDYTNGISKEVPQTTAAQSTIPTQTIPTQTTQQSPQSKQSTTITPTSFSLEQIQQMAQKERDESIIEAKLLNEEKKKLSASATSIDLSKNVAKVLLDSEKKEQMVQNENVRLKDAEDKSLKQQESWLKQEAAAQSKAASEKKRQLEEMTAAKLVADRKREQEEAARLKATAEAAKKDLEEKQKQQQMKKPNRHAKLAEQAEHERKMSELTITDKAATQLNQSGISDEMTDLLDEIENELNDSWFDESPDNEVEEDVGNKDEDGVRRYMDPSADTASLCEHENEEMMVEEEEEPVAADSSTGDDDHQEDVAASPRVRLEQKHNEETRDTSTSAGTVDKSAGISSSSNPNNMTEANNTQIEPPMHLPETVEKLVESSITENIIPSSIQQKNDEDREISQLTVSSDFNTAPDIKIDKGHERNKSASDLLDDLESDSVSNSSININVSETITTPKRGNNSMEISSQEKKLENKVDDTVNTCTREIDQPSALSSSDDDVKNEVPTTTQSILKSTSTESADPQHHAADEIAAPLSINSDEDAYTDLFKNIPLPEGEDEDERKFCQGFELCHRCLFSIWSNELSTGDVVTAITAGLSNVKRKRLIWEDEEECGGDQNKKPAMLVPLVYVYTAWSYILGLKSNNNNHRTGGAGIHQGKMYTWLVSNHRQLSAFDDLPISEELGSSSHLPEASIAVCNYVCKALRDIGLVSIYEADDNTSDNSSPSPSSKQPSLFVGIDSNIFDECIQKRGNDITLDGRLLHDCHECLAPLVYPRIIAGAANDNTYDPLSKNLVWYSCRHAVRHLIESGSLEKAKLLLFDDTFTRQRLQTMGLLEATTAYCRDCSRMNVCIAESLDEWRRKQLQEADMKREISTSPMDDYGYHGSAANHPPDVESWNEDHFKILCSVSKVLREKAEEVRAVDNYDESKRRNIQKDIGNSMQMIGECIGDIGVHRAQEMEHYEEALRLKSEAYGDDQNHPEVADILYIKGCHHQKFRHYKFAQKCYEQALRIYKVTLGYEHPCVARVLHNIGIMYHAKKDNVVALKCLKKSLSIRLSQLGETDLSVADSYCWIGKINREKKSFSKARACFTTAHRIKVAILGKTHIESAEVLYNIGIVALLLIYHLYNLLLIHLVQPSSLISSSPILETISAVSSSSPETDNLSFRLSS